MGKRILKPEFLDLLSSIKDKPYAEALSLPGSFYTDASWLDFERERLFAQQWICVGRQEEVSQPGDYITIDLASEPVLVIHGHDGKIRALSNVCRHRGTVIAKESGNVKSLLCPYHHWAYDTTGELLNAPLIEPSSHYDLKNCRLPELLCEHWQGFLFVSLSPSPPDLQQLLVPLESQIKNYHLEEMRLRYLVNESWPVNWKSLVENFMEGYHLSPLHRNTLHKVNPTSLCRQLTPGQAYFGYKVGFSARVPEDRIGHSDLSDEELDTCVMFAVPPALTVGIGSDYSSFLCIRPESVDKVHVKMGLIFYGDNWPQKQVDDAIGLFQETMQEDKAVLEQVQYGMQSRFHAPGPLAPPDMEGTVWDFYQYLARTLEQEQTE
ncbi:MAG: aromatic ring-hydroxylating oxygenase subunit alpha [bacterium]